LRCVCCFFLCVCVGGGGVGRALARCPKSAHPITLPCLWPPVCGWCGCGCGRGGGCLLGALQRATSAEAAAAKDASPVSVSSRVRALEAATKKTAEDSPRGRAVTTPTKEATAECDTLRARVAELEAELGERDAAVKAVEAGKAQQAKLSMCAARRCAVRKGLGAGNPCGHFVQCRTRVPAAFHLPPPRFFSAAACV
jgi:hypothetical protein